MVIFACKKSNVTNSTILAGDTSGEGIIYKNLHDVDVTAPYWFDIDNDNQDDFCFIKKDSSYQNTYSSGWYGVKGNETNQLIYIARYSSLILALKKGDKITENLSWVDCNDVNNFLFSFRYESHFLDSGGSWRSNTDGYLGFKIIKSSATYLGWIRIVTSLNSYVIRDFAYRKI
jgi:hypothetical protein